ncbi:signal peptidase I [Nocardioides antri]|uniref:Signal peptidase I n=1 Tax=Nocardioides antri TaxID=2607659 RepID=A0A5B1LTX7_9ACTN|nr:signal peptidase I [Nocardioides antri]KAA1424122.1 signal peptidase I [Nocardioides antri]
MSSPGRVLGWLGQVVAWSFVIAVTAVLTATVAVPRLAGATPYTVLTSSMEPGMPAGSLVVVKPVEPDQLGVGTVITYQLESGKADVVTHRVVAVENAINGEQTFITQGDANNVADPEPVRPVQIKGERWYAMPYLGHVNKVLTGSQRQMAVYVVGSLLLAYAAFMFTGSMRERSRTKREARAAKEQTKEDVLA